MRTVRVTIKLMLDGREIEVDPPVVVTSDDVLVTINLHVDDLELVPRRRAIARSRSSWRPMRDGIDYDSSEQ